MIVHTVTQLLTAASLLKFAVGAVHIVTAGQNGFMYQPNNISANVGDIVSFQFYPSNHSVIQGQYCGNTEGGCNPCIPIHLIDNTMTGFFSQNFLTDRDPSPQNLQFQTYNVTINDTNPIWFYCDAPLACTQDGMVGVINAADGTSVERQSAAATSAPYQLDPGQPLPGSNSTASPTPKPSHSSLSDGAIAGIVVGTVAFIALGFTLVYFIGKSRAHEKTLRQQATSHAANDTHCQTEYTPSMQHNSLYKPSPWSPVAQMSPNQPGQTFEDQFQNPYYPNLSLHDSLQSPGVFVGFNSATGIAEFAQEAPAENENMIANGGHEDNATHELPGEDLSASEMGPYR